MGGVKKILTIEGQQFLLSRSVSRNGKHAKAKKAAQAGSVQAEKKLEIVSNVKPILQELEQQLQPKLQEMSQTLTDIENRHKMETGQLIEFAEKRVKKTMGKVVDKKGSTLLHSTVASTLERESELSKLIEIMETERQSISKTVNGLLQNQPFADEILNELREYAANKAYNEYSFKIGKTIIDQLSFAFAAGGDDGKVLAYDAMGRYLYKHGLYVEENVDKKVEMFSDLEEKYGIEKGKLKKTADLVANLAVAKAAPEESKIISRTEEVATAFRQREEGDSLSLEMAIYERITKDDLKFLHDKIDELKPPFSEEGTKQEFSALWESITKETPKAPDLRDAYIKLIQLLVDDNYYFIMASYLGEEGEEVNVTNLEEREIAIRVRSKMLDSCKEAKQQLFQVAKDMLKKYKIEGETIDQLSKRVQGVVSEILLSEGRDRHVWHLLAKEIMERTAALRDENNLLRLTDPQEAIDLYYASVQDDRERIYAAIATNLTEIKNELSKEEWKALYKLSSRKADSIYYSNMLADIGDMQTLLTAARAGDAQAQAEYQIAIEVESRLEPSLQQTNSKLDKATWNLKNIERKQNKTEGTLVAIAEETAQKVVADTVSKRQGMLSHIAREAREREAEVLAKKPAAEVEGDIYKKPYPLPASFENR